MDETWTWIGPHTLRRRWRDSSVAVGFDFGLFFRLTYLSLFEAKGTQARLTRKRVVFLLGFYPIFATWQFINWFFLLADHVLFPGFRNVEVREPVFIVGNPRSGSTHLQRVLAQDEETFACARLWELLLAPSITQRKIVRALARLDRRLGGRLQSWLQAWEERAFREAGTYHRIRLREPDEDELILLPIFSAIHLAFPFPFFEEFTRYIFFDQQLPEHHKRRFMRYYKRTMQRTLYLYGEDKHLLSKTPANSGRVGALHDVFPDGKFIYTTRNPADLIPSTMSLFAFQSGVFCDLLEPYPYGEYVAAMTRHWYTYTVDRLEQMPAGSHTVVTYDHLVGDLRETVRGVYSALGLDVTPEYEQALGAAAARANQYSSNHRYSLEDMGLTREQIEAEFADVYERFGFAVEKREGAVRVPPGH